MRRFTLLAEGIDVTSVEVLIICLSVLSIYTVKTHHGSETVT